MILTLRLVIGFALLTLARIVALHFSVVDLFYDEAQYWAWAQTPAFGYFSKPPLLAWIITAAGHVCGSSEACVRAPAPLLYFGTALATCFIARTLYGARIAAWSGIALMLAPGVIFSARIISTDVPLLFCWALCVLAFVKLRERVSWPWAVLFGAAFGFGLLAKYAMIYLLLGVGSAALVDGQSRALLRRPHLWFAILLGFLILLPNFIWVASHDFVTFRHTEDNISGTGLRINPLGLLEFFGSQFGVFGPLIFAAFLLLLKRTRLRAMPDSDRVMIAFATVPLAAVAPVALFSQANANWAAPSAITLVIVAVAALVRKQDWRWLYATAALGVVVQTALWWGDVRAEHIGIVKGDLYHRSLGWDSLGEQAAILAREKGAKAVVSEHRDVVAVLIYYMRHDQHPVLSWPTGKAPEHQFDIDRPVTVHSPEPLLYLTACAFPTRFRDRFENVEALGRIASPTGPTSERIYFAYLLSGALKDPAPFLTCDPG